MAHEFESGFFTGEGAWHGLGLVIPEAAEFDDIPKLAPLVASEVHKQQLYHNDSPVAGYFANVREIDQKVVGIVQGKYNVIQNMDAFELGKLLITLGSVILENVFSLRGGKWAVAVFKWKNSIADAVDPVIKYLIIVNTFDGSAPLKVFFSGIRAVCMNTVRAAIDEAQNMLIIRHTESSDEKLKLAKDTIEAGKNYFERMDELFAMMKSKTFTADQLAEVVRKTWNFKEGEEVSKKTLTQQQNILDKVLELSRTGKGTNLPGVQGTAWGAFNAISEFTDHYSTMRIHGTGGDENVKAAKEGEARVYSNLFGTSNVLKEKAMENIFDVLAIAA
jgi:phage/plasmid-like protein (TIGR03299 family)